MGGLAGGGMAGALSGTGLSMATQALLTGATAGVCGGSTARLLSGSGITPVTVTQDALVGGAGGLVTYGVASAYQQATAPKPSTTSLQERANLAAQLSEAEGCEGGSGTNLSNQINGNSYDINKLQETQSYTYSENVAALKETITQEGPNSVPPIAIRVYNGQVLVVDGHHRLEAFRQLGYDRVPVKYVHGSQLGKILPNGTYYRPLQELLDAIEN